MFRKMHCFTDRARKSFFWKLVEYRSPRVGFDGSLWRCGSLSVEAGGGVAWEEFTVEPRLRELVFTGDSLPLPAGGTLVCPLIRDYAFADRSKAGLKLRLVTGIGNVVNLMIARR
jgi:hypothetical protein